MPLQTEQAHLIKQLIIDEALKLGFSACAISKPQTNHHAAYLKQFLNNGYAADMHYLHDNLDKRLNPQLLLENTQSIICVRMDYLSHRPAHRYIPHYPNTAVISHYAQGRDYHKTLRQQLKKLALIIDGKLKEMGINHFAWRPFTDSAPILEKTLAEQAGLGFTGKNTLLIHPKAGSFFFLAELFTNLNLPFDEPPRSQMPSCGSCNACIDICPTQAIVAPYQLDARRCISYLTIEYNGIIPLEFRQAIGNRVFGCDDCQLICPWNKFAKTATLPDFNPRQGLDDCSLLDLWHWTESDFLSKTEGSPIRRTGYDNFKRNIAIGLGNAPANTAVLNALIHQADNTNDMVTHHIVWAIEQQKLKLNSKEN